MDVSQLYQKCYERLLRESDKFELELNCLRREVEMNDVVNQLKKDLIAESEVALNVKGVERAEISLGCALALSEHRSNNSEATTLFQTMIEQNCSQLDQCYFWIAIARFHLGEFREARIWCEKLLLRRPDDAVSRSLLNLVRNRVMRDGFSGLGIVVAVAFLSAVAGNVFGNMRRSV